MLFQWKLENKVPDDLNSFSFVGGGCLKFIFLSFQ